ncbi:MAG TPA: arylsulfotransferase family protein [Acidimicrobiales bacterium]|nr:arylsulfotransferase family protein [Acidimicrobiales bacterium]
MDDQNADAQASAQEATPIGSTKQASSAPRLLPRRKMIMGAGSGLAALAVGGLAGYEWPHKGGGAPSTTTTAPSGPGAPFSPTSTQAASSIESFVTRPDLLPPKVQLTTFASSDGAAAYIFLSPRNYIAGAPGQAGLMILDRAGRLIWFMPITAAPFDFNSQIYEGRPVLTWWQGELVTDYGQGVGKIASSSYDDQKTLRAGDGLLADLHELQITEAGTALITAYGTVSADTASAGGSPKGTVADSHVQEIDVATGKVLFDWASLDHIPLVESYVNAPKSGVYDYFHVNSIAEMEDGNFLISAKNTCALYKLDRSSGRVIWRMGGKRSDFRILPEAEFYYQHDARPHGPTSISVMDNGYAPVRADPTRALVLKVDEGAKEVALAHAYRHPAGFPSGSQGNVQLLPDGRVFVGWGNQPYFSEFAADGALLLDGQFPIGYHSYRAYCLDWTGAPTGLPAVAVRVNPAAGSVVYASWNGATGVRRWTVLAGADPTSLTAIGSQPVTGFETSIAVNSSGPYFAVVAVGSDGKEMSRSQVTALFGA